MQTKIRKYPIYPTLPRRSSEPVVVPQALNDGPLVSTKLSDVHGGNMGVCIDFEMGEQKEEIYLSTQSEETPTEDIYLSTQV